MTEKNLLEQILYEVQGMKQSFGSLENRMDKMDDRFDSIDLRLDKMDDHLNKMDDRLDKMDDRLDKMDNRMDNMDLKIDRNYDAVMSFFARQQEINTETSEKLNFIMGQLDMHNRQIAIHTSILKQHRFS